jgi:hypothetical protein
MPVPKPAEQKSDSTTVERQGVNYTINNADGQRMNHFTVVPHRPALTRQIAHSGVTTTADGHLLRTPPQVSNHLPTPIARRLDFFDSPSVSPRLSESKELDEQIHESKAACPLTPEELKEKKKMLIEKYNDEHLFYYTSTGTLKIKRFFPFDYIEARKLIELHNLNVFIEYSDPYHTITRPNNSILFATLLDIALLPMMKVNNPSLYSIAEAVLRTYVYLEINPDATYPEIETVFEDFRRDSYRETTFSPSIEEWIMDNFHDHIYHPKEYDCEPTDKEYYTLTVERDIIVRTANAKDQTHLKKIKEHHEDIKYIQNTQYVPIIHPTPPAFPHPRFNPPIKSNFTVESVQKAALEEKYRAYAAKRRAEAEASKAYHAIIKNSASLPPAEAAKLIRDANANYPVISRLDNLDHLVNASCTSTTTNSTSTTSTSSTSPNSTSSTSTTSTSTTSTTSTSTTSTTTQDEEKTGSTPFVLGSAGLVLNDFIDEDDHCEEKVVEDTESVDQQPKNLDKDNN